MLWNALKFSNTYNLHFLKKKKNYCYTFGLKNCGNITCCSMFNENCDDLRFLKTPITVEGFYEGLVYRQLMLSGMDILVFIMLTASRVILCCYSVWFILQLSQYFDIYVRMFG